MPPANHSTHLTPTQKLLRKAELLMKHCRPGFVLVIVFLFHAFCQPLMAQKSSARTNEIWIIKPNQSKRVHDQIQKSVSSSAAAAGLTLRFPQADTLDITNYDDLNADGIVVDT